MTKGRPTVTRRRRIPAVRIPKSCDRCKRRLTSTEIRNGWAVSDGDGHVVGTICSPYLSVEEMADAVIFEATKEAALNLYDGRILVRNKRFPTPTG
jgi:hypothetical protein